MKRRKIYLWILGTTALMILIAVGTAFVPSYFSEKRVQMLETKVANGNPKDFSNEIIYLTGYRNESAFFNLTSVNDNKLRIQINGQDVKPGYYKIEEGDQIIITVIKVDSGQVIDFKDFTQVVRKGDNIYSGSEEKDGKDYAFICVRHGDGINLINPLKFMVNTQRQFPLRELTNY